MTQELVWIDEYLEWAPILNRGSKNIENQLILINFLNKFSIFLGINTLYIPSNLLWTPDIILFESFVFIFIDFFT